MDLLGDITVPPIYRSSHHHWCRSSVVAHATRPNAATQHYEFMSIQVLSHNECAIQLSRMQATDTCTSKTGHHINDHITTCGFDILGASTFGITW